MKKVLILSVIFFIGCSEMKPKEIREQINECFENDLGYFAKWSTVSSGITEITCCPYGTLGMPTCIKKDDR